MPSRLNLVPRAAFLFSFKQHAELNVLKVGRGICAETSPVCYSLLAVISSSASQQDFEQHKLFF